MRDRIQQVRRNIIKAASASGRISSEISLVAVSKTRSIEEINEAYKNGIIDFGENRVQELQSKIRQLPNVNWHMVGSLQTNKVKYIIDKIKLLHSLDRLTLAQELNNRASQKKIVVSALIQVNVAQEASKSGLAVNEVLDFCIAISDLSHIKIQGLMTIAPYCDKDEQVRGVFKELAGLRNTLINKVPKAIELAELSMGMSGDYMVAIEEGATIIRLGTTIFEERITKGVTNNA